MTRIVCISDLHEHLVDIPACDLLLIAGDVSFAFKGDLRSKQAFLARPFKDWLDRLPADEVVLVAGNHDQSIETWGLPDGLRNAGQSRRDREVVARTPCCVVSRAVLHLTGRCYT
jgi:metallophosphoesterase superfamily enzyme